MTERRGGRTFAFALLAGVLGGCAAGVGLGAAFERAGNWANHLVELGLVLLAAAALANVVACVRGLRAGRAGHGWPAWWFVSLLLVVATLAAGALAASL